MSARRAHVAVFATGSRVVAADERSAKHLHVGVDPESLRARPVQEWQRVLVVRRHVAVGVATMCDEV